MHKLLTFAFAILAVSWASAAGAAQIVFLPRSDTAGGFVVQNTGVASTGSAQGSVFTSNDGINPGSILINAQIERQGKQVIILPVQLSVFATFSEHAAVLPCSPGCTSLFQSINAMSVEAVLTDGSLMVRSFIQGPITLNHAFIPQNQIPATANLHTHQHPQIYESDFLPSVGATDFLAPYGPFFTFIGDGAPSLGPGGALAGFQGALAFGAIGFNYTYASVPEPMTWAMMIVGFGLSGVGIRRSRARLLAV